MRSNGPLKSTGWRYVWCLGIAAACASMGDRAAELKASVVGLPARELNRCAGVPSGVRTEGPVEFLTYRFFLNEDGDTPRPDDPLDRSTRFPRPQPTTTEGVLPDDGEPPRGIGFCELVFEVTEGKVVDLKVRGRRASGLNDDARCSMRVKECANRRGRKPVGRPVD